MQILNTEIEFDFFDIDEMERLQKEVGAFIDAVQAVDVSDENGFSSLREMCRLTEELFDTLFGEGTSEKLFAGKHANLKLHLQAFEDLRMRQIDANKELDDFRVRAISSGPQPYQNRAERRRRRR